MITLGICYTLISLLSLFTALIIVRYYEWDSYNPGIVFYPAAMFLAWPILAPATLLVYLGIAMDKLSTKAAKRLKNKR